VEETIPERQIEICDDLVKNFGRVFRNFRHVFSKTLFSSFKICVVYLAIFVVYLAKPDIKIHNIIKDINMISIIIL